ncbi:hypothetical protein ABT369_30910 [Dactylosporangium sp. NPDC000244]|uniref:hypothetical protein n=1 Tax=Dactylosporangium sp. NPDC000244 TaxID=3154365 RepID=UPI00331D63FA
MSAPEQQPHVLVEWAQYVAVVRGSMSDRYARFYAPLAIGSAALAFLPLFEDVVVRDAEGNVELTTRYGTVFDMAGRPGGGPAVIGVLLLGVLVAALTYAAFRARTALVPGVIAACAGLIALMLATKPGTGTPTPDLTDGGVAGLVLALCAAALGIAHAIPLSMLKRAAGNRL